MVGTSAAGAATKLASAQLQELLAKVELREDAELTALWPQSAGGAVELHLHDGTVRSRRYPYPPGHPRLPLTERELAAKFHEYADPVLAPAGALALREAVRDLESCPDLRELTGLLAPRAAPVR